MPPSPPSLVCEPEGELCGMPLLGCVRSAVHTPLHFDSATVAYSNLGGAGPDSSRPPYLRLNGVATLADGSGVDLLVGTASTYTPFNTAGNGLKNGFGVVNVAVGSSVTLTFSFVASGSAEEAVELESFFFSLYDLDLGIILAGTTTETLLSGSHSSALRSAGPPPAPTRW